LSSDAITTTQAVELLISYGGSQSQSTTITDGVGWTNVENTSDGTNAQTFFAQYQIVTSMNTYTGLASASPATTYGMGIVSLRSAISSTSPNAAIASFSTGTLASGSSATGTITMAKTFALLHVTVSAAARLRCLSRAAIPAAKIGRAGISQRFCTIQIKLGSR